MGWNCPYLLWDLSDPETAAAAVLIHGFEWVFVRTAPILMLAGLMLLIGMLIRRRKEKNA